MKIKDITTEDFIRYCAKRENGCKGCPFYEEKIRCFDVLSLPLETRKDFETIIEYLNKDIEIRLTNENK